MATQQASRILSKGLVLLEALAECPDGMEANTVAETMGLHRSSVYRYLNPLIEKGFVEKRTDGSYELGSRVLELATLRLERIDLRGIAHTALISLCEETAATVHMCQLDGPEVVYLDKVETPRTLPLYSRIGGRAPAFCTGVGKALLAFVHPERLERILAQTEFLRYTQNTLPDEQALRDQLSEINQRGYAVDCGEHEENVYCVAAPVFNYAGDTVVSISVTDLQRKFVEHEERYREPLLRTCSAISRKLGFRSKGAQDE